MAEMPLDEISVSLLTKKCKVKRQTFYYYFHDIYDLLTQVFLDEKIPGIGECDGYEELLSTMYNYYENNKSFLDAVLTSGGKDLFLEFLFNSLYQSSMRFIIKIEDSKKLTLNERKAIARFYASAFSVSFLYYLSGYTNKSLQGLQNCFGFVENDALAKSVQNMIAKKKAKENN